MFSSGTCHSTRLHLTALARKSLPFSQTKQIRSAWKSDVPAQQQQQQRASISKEERALRRAARKERANAFLSSMGAVESLSGSAAASSGGETAAVAAAGAAAGKAATSSPGPSVGGPMLDVSRWGWYAAVVVPTAFIGWGIYDENSPPAKLSRFVGLTDQLEEYAKPARTKLLPDWNQLPNIPPDFPQPPTLVLDLENTLVCSSWDRKYGWRHAKRPGLDKFLATLAQYYEIVIFTPSPEGIAMPVLDSLDPKGYVMHRLHREATHYHNGVHTKDLSWLNRSLRKIVVLDDDPAALQFQPGNLIRVKPYDDPTDRDDRTLERITPFLVEISRDGHEDIPAILRQFGGLDAEGIANEHENRIHDLRLRREQVTQRGLGSLASLRRNQDMPAPELPPSLDASSGRGGSQQLTAKDLVGDAPPPEITGGGMMGWLQRRQKQQEEHNREKFEHWNEIMTRKQMEKKKAQQAS